jgi:hypothetical protein
MNQPEGQWNLLLGPYLNRTLVSVILTYPERESENEQDWHPIGCDGSKE